MSIKEYQQVGRGDAHQHLRGRTGSTEVQGQPGVQGETLSEKKKKVTYCRQSNTKSSQNCLKFLFCCLLQNTTHLATESTTIIISLLCKASPGCLTQWQSRCLPGWPLIWRCPFPSLGKCGGKVVWKKRQLLLPQLGTSFQSLRQATCSPSGCPFHAMVFQSSVTAFSLTSTSLTRLRRLDRSPTDHFPFAK